MRIGNFCLEALNYRSKGSITRQHSWFLVAVRQRINLVYFRRSGLQSNLASSRQVRARQQLATKSNSNAALQ